MSPKPEAPIIIIGNGGSGSTLLDRVLNAHPEIHMNGEMKFLVANAWAAFSAADANTTLWTVAQHFDADPGLEARIKSTPTEFRNFLSFLEHEESVRRGMIMRQSVAAWFCLGESTARYWGFKEITNSGAYEWNCYDQVFPEARWVHIIRHPLHQLRAAAQLAGEPLSRETIPGLLATWTANVEMSRRRRSTGRYHEVKYEELHAAPDRALAPLLDDLGIGWHDECHLPLARQWGSRSRRLPLPPEIGTLISATKDLERIMTEYGYHPEDGVMESSTLQVAPLEPAGEGRWRLSGPILREIGRCWEVDLSNTAIADKLAMIADDVGHWERSPLRLYENGNALGSAHALHYRIRRDGAGRYSHWQNRLLFATSNDSNPNSNGRNYTFDLSGREGD